MNNKEKQILSQFPELDATVNKKFPGVKCESKFDLLGSMQYKTVYKAKGELRKQVKLYIEGFMTGSQELSKRLRELKIR